MVEQVPRLHVNSRVVSAGAVYAFAVSTAVGIQFYLRGKHIGESLANLPVGMAIHCLVARVGDMILRLLYGLFGGVLPTVGVL